MKFNFDWWYTYIYLGDPAYRERTLQFLTLSILEAEVSPNYLLCTVPYNRQDCKSLYGIARLCYESLYGLSLPTTNHSINTSVHWWTPAQGLKINYNLNLLPEVVIRTDITDHLRVNHLEPYPGNWLKLLLGTETYYFSVAYAPIEELIWKEGAPVLVQGDNMILGSIIPTEGQYNLMLTYHETEDVVAYIQAIIEQDFSVPKAQQYGNSKQLESRDITVSKQHLQEVLGYMPTLSSLQMYLEQKDETHLHYRIPAYYSHLQEEIDIIEELSVRAIEDLPPALVKEASPPRTIRNLGKVMAMRGYYEVKNFGMISEALALKYKLAKQQQLVYLNNPMSQEGAVMRTSLIPGLLKNLTFNINHFQRKVHIFEIGSVFEEHREVKCLAALAYGSRQHELYKVSNSFAEILGDLGFIVDLELISLQESHVIWLNSKMSKSIWLQDRCIGYIGQLSSTGYHHKHLLPIVHQTYKKHTISGNPFILHIEIEALEQAEFKLKGVNKLPSIYRDITILCSRDASLDKVMQKMKSEVTIPFLEKITLKDIYYGGDAQKKLTFELEFYLPSMDNKSEIISHYMAELEAINFLSL
jgi:hypothetical protein